MSNGVSWFRDPVVNTRRSIMVDQQTNALLLLEILGRLLVVILGRIDTISLAYLL